MKPNEDNPYRPPQVSDRQVAAGRNIGEWFFVFLMLLVAIIVVLPGVVFVILVGSLLLGAVFPDISLFLTWSVVIGIAVWATCYLHAAGRNG